MFEKIKIDLLKKKIEIIKKKYEDEGKFSLFHTKVVNDILGNSKSYEGVKSIYDIIASWEGFYSIPYDIGMFLDELAQNPDTVVCIHRANLDLEKNSNGIYESPKLESIMEEGLINYGHINAAGGSAFLNTPPDLTLTTTPLRGISGYINLIASYKSNDTVVVMAFPEELVDQNGSIKDYSKVDEIYNKKNDLYAIKPDYIIGALIKNNNSFDEFYTREEIINDRKKK